MTGPNNHLPEPAPAGASGLRGRCRHGSPGGFIHAGYVGTGAELLAIPLAWLLARRLGVQAERRAGLPARPSLRL